MTNPSRTLQNSIFEPLYSHHEELNYFQPNMPTQSFSSDWLSPGLSPPFSTAPPCTTSPNAAMKRAAGAIFNVSTSCKDSSFDAAGELGHEHEQFTCDRAILGMCSPSGSSSSSITPTSTPTCPPSRSRSASDVIDHDDGSVASKLLSTITKSISSPSLLACCKESARETPYQKSLRLRTMKLQHCAEELGSESCDGSLCGGDYDINTSHSFNRMSSSHSTRDFSRTHQENEGNASSRMISVMSSPNLGCASLVSKPTSPIKERSFPPPLSHTLPRSASVDSFSYSLRAYREDGRFVLKEVKVPCWQYFQTSRKDGRLMLQCLTTDEDFDSKHASDEGDMECRDLQEDYNVGVYDGGCGGAADKAMGSSFNKIEGMFAKPPNLVGELEVCRMKGSKTSNHVGVNKEKINMEEVRCPSTDESLLMATLSNGNSSFAKDDKLNFISHSGASKQMKSDCKSAKHKSTGKLTTRMRLLNRHLLSSSSNQHSLFHLHGKSPKLKLGHDFGATKFSQCAGNLGLESKSTRGGKSLQGFQVASASLRKPGYGIGKSASSTMIFKDVSAKCLMEDVSKLVASCGLEYGGKWSCGEEIKSDKVSHSRGGISSMYKVESIHFDVQTSPSSTDGKRAAIALVQAKEWSQYTLHCKEIFDRSLAGGSAFMKLHSCVA